MFNNSSHINASNSVFSEVHRDQYYNAQTTVQGSQSVNTVVYGNQVHQELQSTQLEVLQKASAPGATHDSAQRYPAPKCIEGTRVELLGHLTSWIEEPNQKPICWLNGRPGSGKSAVSQTLAETFANQGRLAASFFFLRRDVARRTTQHVVPTLTLQLLTALPSIRPAVMAALEKDCMIPMKVLREQMEKLLLEPTSTATEVLDKPLLIVIDALDECEEQNAVLEFVSLLALLPQKTSLPLRLLITSRSEPWLQSRFCRQDISALVMSLEIHAFSAEEDIRLFLRRALDNVYNQHLQVMRDTPRPWPSLDQLDCIINKSGGLFIFALTVVKFVGDKMHNPAKRLQEILEEKDLASTESAYADLDVLYRDAISAFPNPDAVRLVLGLSYCMETPLSIPALHKLLPRPDVDVRIIVPALSSVLLASEDGEQPIQFYHASFRDFLTNPQRSQKYAIDPDVYHRLMAQLSLETMSNSLKRDMCGIRDPSKANNEVPDLSERCQAAFDEALLYACRFWSHHLAQLPRDGIVDEALLGALQKFSTTVLLCWIEALSILGELENAVVLLRECISWLKTLHKFPGDILTLLEDADRLVVFFMDPISECALHVYVTALSSVPKSSVIFKTFQHQSYGSLIWYPDRDDWSVTRTDLALHHPIYSVVFSPSGKMIATAGVDQGVQLWNTVTGGNIASLGDRSSTALFVCFSPSGAFLAAAFEGSTIVVWDPEVGREHLKHERCHSEPIACMEFSQNSALLASGSSDCAIHVWSVETAQSLYSLSMHKGPVTSLVFSTDSLRLFSGSADNSIGIWDMSSGMLIRGITGHQKTVNCVAISKDGSIVASGSEDKTVKLWDVESGKCKQTFSKGHYSGVQSVHFFDEDKYVIAACDEAILAWGVDWRKTSNIITAYEDAILSWGVDSRKTSNVLWTRGEFIEKTLKTMPAWQANLLGWAAPRRVVRLALSFTDGSPIRHFKIAYAKDSSTFAFTVRDSIFAGLLPTPVKEMPLGTSAEMMTALAISSDGNWAAVGDSLGSLRIMNLTMPRPTWEALVAESKSNPLLSTSGMTPSPDGTRFVMKCLTQWVLADENYRVVKKIDMGMLESFRDTGSIRFKFSPEGSIFFCVISKLFMEDNSTLRIFNSLKGEQRALFTGLKKVLSFVASAGGAWIACGGASGRVDIFGVTGKTRTNITVPDHSPIHALCFSSDTQTLMGGTENGVVHVWDRASKACRATFNVSTSMVTALAHTDLTNGDAWVAIGHENGAVSLWSPSRSTSYDILRSDQATAQNVDFIRFSEDGTRLTSRSENGAVFTWAITFDTDNVDMTRCTLCNTASAHPSKPRTETSDSKCTKSQDDSKATSPHLLSQFDPEEAVDSLFHTTYRMRKDGWLVKDDRRVLWLPPSSRPSGKDKLWAYKSGLVAFFTPVGKLTFLKWVENDQQ